ncbi:hypothetical protein EMIT0P218_30245 [Pseudomonas sp. IT-P218]
MFRCVKHEPKPADPFWAKTFNLMQNQHRVNLYISF